ncbi:AraC-like DNA-binding protein [Salegentibacter sp. 24]|nr:AraC-like DNA-binding protein [Salegentibacter sp. 24]
MTSLLSLNRVLQNHPLFLSITIINYDSEITSYNLIGSGKVYLNFIYGSIQKINSDGTRPELGRIQLQPVENYFSLQAEKGAKLITLAIKPFHWNNITKEDAKNARNSHFDMSMAVSGALLNLLYQELEQVNCPDKALEKIDNYFDSFYPQWTKITPIDEIIEDIFKSQGRVAIKDILNKYPFSRSTLNTYFYKQIGVSPKFFIKLIQFNNLLREFLLEKKTISEIIKNWDYYDYSHLKKDFILFTGGPPKNFEKFRDGTLEMIFKNFSYW